MTFDELIEQVNSRYKALQGNDEDWIHKQLKKEFGLTTTELWECLGISDQNNYYFDERILKRSSIDANSTGKH